MIMKTAKVPPQAIEIEQAVISAMLTDRDALVIAMTEITNERIFYLEKHQIVYLAVKSLFDNSKPIDALTVINELKTLGKLESVGGVPEIANLSEVTDHYQNVRAHIAILKQKWIRREVILTSSKNIQHANNETFDEFEILENSSFELLKLNEQLSIKKVESGKEIYKRAMEEIATAMQSPGATGLMSKINELDQVTGGWQSPDLVIVAGRPGMGKTAFALSATKDIFLKQNKKVLVFSLEMTSVQIIQRLISSMSEISGAKIKKGYLTENEYIELQTKTQSLYTDNLVIDDTPSISIGQLRAKAMSEKIKDRNLALIVVDYLQLMTASNQNGNREREVSMISSGLKALAKELKVPVIALCQLSRAVEARQNKKPQLSDLRESGSIEQDADLVIFIHRPEYYGITEYSDGSSTADTAELVVAKNRHGGTSDVIVKYKASKFEFCSLNNAPEFVNKSLINSVQNNFDTPF